MIDPADIETQRPDESPEAVSPTTPPVPGTTEGGRAGQDLNIIRAGATIIAVLGIITLLHFAASVFITLFSAMLLAFALEPLVQLLCARTPLRRPHASGIVVFLFVAMLYGLFYGAYQRAENFFAEIPVIAEKIRATPMVASLAAKAEEINRVVAEAGRRIAPPAAPSAPPKPSPPVVVQDAGSFTKSLLQGLGSLSGSLSIVPYLGLPLALLPGVVVGLVSFDTWAPFLVLVALVTILHLVAANYLTPKLVGGGVRLNATASTAALLFFGWLWGAMGLMLGIPIVAVLKCIFDNVPSSRRIGMFLGD
jgi:predicted PurR-regulated permease PerM